MPQNRPTAPSTTQAVPLSPGDLQSSLLRHGSQRRPVALTQTEMRSEDALVTWAQVYPAGQLSTQFRAHVLPPGTDASSRQRAESHSEFCAQGHPLLPGHPTVSTSD